MRLSRIRFLVLLCALPACDSFVPPTLVASLRVLAISAEPAEVGSGEQATLRSLVVDATPTDDGGVVTYAWALCTKVPKPGVAIDPACYDTDSADYIVALPTLPDGKTTLVMPQHTIMDIGLPDATGGFYVPVRLRVTSGGQSVTAFHRLRWKAGFVPPNQNPTLMGISFIPTGIDGELPDMGQIVDPQPLPDDGMTPMDLSSGGKLRLRATDAPGSAESYMTFVGDISDPTNIMTTTDTEALQFYWYASAGKLEQDITGEARPDTTLDTTQYADTLPMAGDLVDLWLVAREERGGVDFLHRRIHLTK